VDRIVEVNKPAHTVHRSQAVFPDARVGVQSRVGFDLVLGAASAQPLQVGDGRAVSTDGAGSVLALDTVLGSMRPGYVRRIDSEFPGGML